MTLADNLQSFLSDVFARSAGLGKAWTQRQKDYTAPQEDAKPAPRNIIDKQPRGTAQVRNVLQLHATIKEGARAQRKVRFQYTKRNGATVIRRMLPYSYRGHLLFGKDAHTKSFIINNIAEATLTGHLEKPDYPIEIK